MTNENKHTPIHPELIDEREKVGKVSEEEKKAQDEEQLAINFLDMLASMPKTTSTSRTSHSTAMVLALLRLVTSWLSVPRQRTARAG